MSQAKVDKYKQEKANRQQIMKKQRAMHRLEMTGIAVACAVFFGWVGFSVYDKVANNPNQEKETVVFDASSVQDYLTELAE